MKFKIKSKFKPTGDQPQAIADLSHGIEKDFRDQTLLGVTGSGKTFTMANVIQNAQKPTLIISHNKTLAAQLASEFQEFFPKNAVHYFVSYYDYYQPEAYVAKSDTYIEKETQVNEEIDRLRLASTTALLTRKDVIIVASVSCIYGLGKPDSYQNMRAEFKVGELINRNDALRILTSLQYSRSEYDLKRGTFRVKGDVLEVQPGYEEFAYRIDFFGDEIDAIKAFDPLTGDTVFDEQAKAGEVHIYPAKHYVIEREELKAAEQNIRNELRDQIQLFKKQGKLIEAQRIEERTMFDLEMMDQVGYCNGIENYSRHMDFRKPGEPPATLLDYFPKDFLLFIDESHITVPQIGGMYNGDRARKQTLVNYGFRLPSALDNRPLQFNEFDAHINQAIYVSATPREYELNLSAKKVAMDAKGHINYSDENRIAEQLIRPTGLLDPQVEIKPTKNQIDDLLEQIQARTKKRQRVLVTTLTKRLAEELAEYLAEMGIKVHYLHSEVDTLERLDILRDLRLGIYDVIVGINLLREGLDLPEVSLVVILDADKEGFLRSDTALIQTMGRAARHSDGQVIMYADTMTGSMKRAISEVSRRRSIQELYNRKHGITPTTIKKAVKDAYLKGQHKKAKQGELGIDLKKVSDEEVPVLIKELENKMELAARNLDFEKAAEIRDQIGEVRKRTKAK
ncbi:excinuclease ABC subunit B [bacterium CG10_46_32]|nr:MAG: excinuclease ABC subunit B [bacterium CG10_46_32]PIR55910.1 MAG: excinuclease ABC subunit B [Parcubacteria group bacterium CG10_big_fil_rev_8_21_14_0_10_46_32]